MLTFLPAGIYNIDQAKDFLSDLHDSNETFHPEDDATKLQGNPFTEEEGLRLNELMNDIYNLPGNDGRHDNSIVFCPCAFLLYLNNEILIN